MRLAGFALVGEELPSPGAKPLEPRNRLLVTEPVENDVAQHLRNRARRPVGQHHNAKMAVGQHIQMRAPPDPASAVAHRALATIMLTAETKSVMLVADFIEFRAANMHARSLQSSDPRSGQQLHAVKRAACQVEAQVVRHVGDRHVDPAGRHGANRPTRAPTTLVRKHRVRTRGIGRPLQFLDREPEVPHAKRREDAFAGEVLPGLAGDALGHHARGHVSKVLILIGLADVAARLQMPHRRQHLSGRQIARYPDPVVARQAALVTE